MITIEEFARKILFGVTLEDKLFKTDLSQIVPSDTQTPLVEIPKFPGRPPNLLNFSKGQFPDLSRLREDRTRGEVLHFFANHELLALELMALMLLRFPEAPWAFRLGLARTIDEEQNHMSLYLERMKELGVEFGDLPLSEYFWTTMSKVPSVLDFVVQMSLTFEQANLDFSLFFRDEIAKVGDQKTADILERVYREEIGHVKHGTAWFNRWRGNAQTESDWDAYVKLLPPPLTPRRAKGMGTFCIEARREAGLSEAFIRELKLCSSSKGRPPVIWYFNPHCDSEIVRGTPGFTPTLGSKRMSGDLKHVPMFLAHDEDIIIVESRPSREWLEMLQRAGFSTPELFESVSTKNIRAQRIGGFEPWGWSPDAAEFFKPLEERLVKTQVKLEPANFTKERLGRIFSKSWSAAFLEGWLERHPETRDVFGFSENSGFAGRSYKSETEAYSAIDKLHFAGRAAMVKAPFGTSGANVRRVATKNDLTRPLEGWIRNIIESQGEIVVEEFLNKTCDLSVQIEIGKHRTTVLETRKFVTGSRAEYRGTYLGKRLIGFTEPELRLLHRSFEPWERLARDLGNELRALGYLGPAGIDALIWRDQSGELRLKPLVELNPRWTMGRVALALEERLAPGTQGIWRFFSRAEIASKGFDSIQSFAASLCEKYPVKMAQTGQTRRIEHGVIATNDPSRAQEVLTVLGTLPNPDLEVFY